VAITDAEIEALRFHLGYGNLDFGAYPYSPDGFKELFRDVVAPNLTGTTETTATTAITAGATVAVTPVSMTGIVVNARLVVDVSDAVELVTVKSVSGGNFTATFAKAHPATGYPIALMGGLARLRLMLSQADAAWQAWQDLSIAALGGLKSVDKGDVVWQDNQKNAALDGRLRHYREIVKSLSSLVRVPPVDMGRTSALEAY